MATRAPRQGRGRIRLPKNFQPTVAALTWTAAVNATKLRITTATPYIENSLPNITVQGVLPTAFTAISATVFDLTYAASVVTTNVVIVPPNDPGIRSAQGAFLNAGTVTL